MRGDLQLEGRCGSMAPSSVNSDTIFCSSATSKPTTAAGQPAPRVLVQFVPMTSARFQSILPSAHTSPIKRARCPCASPQTEAFSFETMMISCWHIGSGTRISRMVVLSVGARVGHAVGM